jgi:3-oxoacyl-[acyl-carrier-protein] synthase III
VGEKLGLDKDRVVDCIGEYGNTSAEIGGSGE